MSFRGDLSAIGKFGASIEAKSRALPAVAAAAVEELRPVVSAQLAAAETPYGAAWAPKKDGGRALAHAEIALSTRGAAVVASIDGPLVYHNAGTGHDPRRQIIPDEAGGLPATWRRALDAASARVMGGA